MQGSVMNVSVQSINSVKEEFYLPYGSTKDNDSDPKDGVYVLEIGAYLPCRAK
jgi:hypothetical protein